MVSFAARIELEEHTASAGGPGKEAVDLSAIPRASVQVARRIPDYAPPGMPAIGSSGELEEHRLVPSGCIQLKDISGACSTGEFCSAIEVAGRVSDDSRIKDIVLSLLLFDSFFL
jgi:hypothetical protein